MNQSLRVLSIAVATLLTVGQIPALAQYATEFVPAKLPAHATTSKSQVRVGHSVSFHATGCSIDPALIVKFRWKFDDGTTATGPTVSHAFQHAGKHHASVTVFDRAGRRGTATVTVTVLAH